MDHDPLFSRLNGSTVLVTGAAGFIGSHLVDHLLAQGARVIGVDNLSTGKLENLAGAMTNPAVTFIRADVNRLDEIASVFGDHRIDYVFHYAAVVGVQNVIERPLEVFKDIDGIKFLLALSHAHRVKKVVFASSSEAYGEPRELPEREDGHLNVNANDPYALTKLVGENLLRNYGKRYGLPGVSLRFFNVYGPRQNASAYGFVAGIFMQRALRGEPPVVFGDGTQTRDFVYIDDNVEAAIRALVNDRTDGEVVNVGSGRMLTILELAERVIRLSGVPLQPIFQPLRAMEVKYRCPDTTKMRELLGFTPRVSLDDGLMRTLAWFREQP